MKKIKLYFLLYMMITGFACKDAGLEPADKSFTLTVEDGSCTEVWLKIKIGVGYTNREVILKRDTIVLFTKTLNDLETLVIDTNLLPNHAYSYIAQLTNGSKASGSPLQVRTLDTTSHSVQWIVDTLGAQGVIRDVWVFDRNNAWAVGEIYLNDGNGKPDLSNPYNAAHWDGNEWQVQRVYYLYQGKQYVSPLYTIYAFSTDDIFFAGNGVIHWDGKQFQNVDIPISVWSAMLISKAWGSSNNDLYIVGGGGAIAQYNGNSWTKMTSNTTVNLQDIYGLDATHIWATGTNISDGHSVVLQCNGSQWTTLFDSNTQPVQSQYQFGTVWTNTSSLIYLDGGSGLHSFSLSNIEIGSQIHTGQTYVSYRIRGTLKNDIFDIGQASEAAHFNGVRWYLYPELRILSNGHAWFYSVIPRNDMIVIGGLFLTELNSTPIVVRGYR